MAPQAAQERRQQILESETPAEDARVLEQAARREGLERLDEAMRAGALEEALDRPRPALDARLPRALLALLPHQQHRHVDAKHLAATIERDGLGAAVRLRNRDHRIGGAEVDADARSGRWSCCHGLGRDGGDCGTARKQIRAADAREVGEACNHRPLSPAGIPTEGDAISL